MRAGKGDETDRLGEGEVVVVGVRRADLDNETRGKNCRPSSVRPSSP